jgi:Xaa-Pro aminopeptidase
MRTVLAIATALLVFFSNESQFHASATSSENKNDKEMRMKLLQAEKVSAQLFEAVEKNLIVSGKTESQLSEEITTLALEKFGVKEHWHKKIVRTGKNTLATYNENPTDQVIQKDDILFVDYGIILDGFEADYARTYVLGNDPKKIKLQKDVEKAWYETQAWYKQQTKLKASDFFSYIVNKANEYGYTYGGIIAGHIVGEYPHEQPANRKSFDLDVHPDNPNDMFLLDANGNKRHWILEMHFVDKKNNIAAYMEQLL